jgi:hypothetical protein
MMAVLLFLLLFFGVPLVCMLAVRVARDMDARGEAGWRYGLLVLCLPPVGLVAWLTARTRRSVADS